jgi:hypothetical protein
MKIDFTRIPRDKHMVFGLALVSQALSQENSSYLYIPQRRRMDQAKVFFCSSLKRC